MARYYKPSRKKVRAKGGRRSKRGFKQIMEGGKIFTYVKTDYSDERYIATAAREMRSAGYSVRTRSYGKGGAFAIFRRKK